MPRKLSLTDREKEVLALMACGKTNKAIAAELYITLRAVEFHVTHILNKLGVCNRTEAVLYALRHKLVDGDNSLHNTGGEL